MRYLTKNRALLSAAALLAGISLASAQGMKEQPGGGGGGAPAASGGGAPSAAPSGAEPRGAKPAGGEKMDRGQAQRPSMQDRTTGQGASESKQPGAKEQMKEQTRQQPAKADKADKAVQDKAAQDKAKSTTKSTPKSTPKSTTGQGTRESAQPDTKAKPSGKSDSSKSEPAQRQQTQSPSDSKPGTTGAGTATQSQPSGTQGQASSVTLDAQKQASIQKSVLSARNAPRVSNVNFAISTGTVVPSHVRYVSISTFPILIETFPQYRGYSFFIVEEEIVIIEPRSRRIVQVVPVGSGRASRGGGTSVEVLQLSEPEIREIQLVLVQRGLLVRTHVTGVLDERTKTALISFQRKQGLQASGSIDMRTVTALGLSSKVGPQKQGASGASSTTGQSPASTQQPQQPSAQPSAQQPSAQQPSAQQPQGTTGQAPSSTGQAPAQQGGQQPSAAPSNQGTTGSTQQPAQSPAKKDAPAQSNTGSQAPAR